MSKKVNVCVCAKNRQAVLKTTMKSLLEQTSDDYSILLCDGKSTDMTMNIMLDYQREYPGKVIAWQTDEEGYVNTHNFILSKTDAEYICFVDSDDFVDNKKIEEQVKFLDEHPDVDVVTSCVMFPDKRVLANSFVELDNDTISKALESNMSMRTICHFQSAMFRRTCLDKFTNKKFFFDEFESGLCGEGFLYTLHFLGYKFANIISTVYVYTHGLNHDSMSEKGEPEFANLLDMQTYDMKKTAIIEMFNNYNPLIKKRGRPKKTK